MSNESPTKLKSEEWEELAIEKRSKHEQLNAGMQAGWDQAVSDYLSEKACLRDFPTSYTRNDLASLDFFALGFELGYQKKLVEILSC